MENEKYVLLNNSLDALNKDVFNLLICAGDYGMGKSHRILGYVKENDIDHAYIQSYATPLKFYELLYKNKDKKFIIFDDVNSIDNNIIIGMLKSACWGVLNNKRDVSYYSSSEAVERLKLPEKFDLKANIVLIFNNKMNDYAPIINRGVCIDFDFSFDEKIQILKDVQEKAKLDKDIINYVEKHYNGSASNISIRSIVILSRLKEKSFDWKQFSKEILKIDVNKNLLIKLFKKDKKTACEKWCLKTGLSRKTYYNYKKSVKV